jgi:hypothetical protein
MTGAPVNGLVLQTQSGQYFTQDNKLKALNVKKDAWDREPVGICNTRFCLGHFWAGRIRVPHDGSLLPRSSGPLFPFCVNQNTPALVQSSVSSTRALSLPSCHLNVSLATDMLAQAHFTL